MRVFLFLSSGKVFSATTIRRMLARLRYVYRVSAVQCAEADHRLILLHKLGLLGTDLHRIYFLDECHISTRTAISRYGWRPQGGSNPLRAPLRRNDRASVIAVLGLNGVVSHDIKPGSINGDEFRDFIAFKALVRMPRGSILVMDNCRIHYNRAALALLNIAEITVWWLPPYSPAWNPIEIIWGALKTKMRSSSMRDLTQLWPTAAAHICIQAFYEKNMKGIYNRCGYDWE
jgi:transposase